MDRQSFEDLRSEGQRIEDELNGFDFTLDDAEGIDSIDSNDDDGHVFNEYGEIEDDLPVNEDDLSIDDSSEDSTTPTTQSLPFALNHPATQQHPQLSNSWLKRSYLAPNETDKEFELFKIFCRNPGGRSMDYISRLSHIQPSALNRIAKKNSWKRRASDYDTAELAAKVKQAETSRHKDHIRRLDKYREEQEALGQQITSNAARIALLANSTLAKLLDEDTMLGVRDLPAMLNAAAKLAEVGKNLQSSALGVDNLLAALEEGED